MKAQRKLDIGQAKLRGLRGERGDGNKKIKNLLPEIEEALWIRIFLVFECAHNQIHSLNEAVVFYKHIAVQQKYSNSSHRTFSQVVPYQ